MFLLLKMQQEHNGIDSFISRASIFLLRFIKMPLTVWTLPVPVPEYARLTGSLPFADAPPHNMTKASPDMIYPT